MPRIRDPLVAANFLVQYKSDRAGKAFATCKHCGKQRTRGASRLKSHLSKCSRHLANSSAKQRKLPLQPIAGERQATLQQLAAEVCFEDNMPFTMWSSPAMRTFLRELAPVFTPPHDTMIRRTLLPKVYLELKTKVDAALASTDAIQLSIDGSTDARGFGVTNISVVHESSAYTLETREVSSTDDGAEEQFRWLKEQARVITQGDLSRLSSVAFDTCATQLKVSRLFEADEEFKHVINVKCDAHGIALFIRDILKTPYCNDVRLAAQALVNQLTRKKAMLSLLKEKQIKRYSQSQVLQNVCDTRWHTYLNLFASLLKSRHALEDVAKDSRCTLETQLKDYVFSYSFWDALEEIVAVLTPMNEELLLAQGTNATMETVLPRWYRLKANLELLAEICRAPVQAFVDGDEESRKSTRSIRGWWERFERQTNKHHVAAHFLNPATEVSPSTPEWHTINSALQSQCRSLEELKSMIDNCMSFIHRSGPYACTSPSWIFATDMLTFWKWHLMSDPDNLLIKYAIRLCTTTANTVTLERSFSALKLVQHRLRNRLTLEHVDQLMYICSNAKTYRKRLDARPSDTSSNERTLATVSTSEDGELGTTEAMAVSEAMADYFELYHRFTDRSHVPELITDSDESGETNDPTSDRMAMKTLLCE